jgi:protein TonB
VDLGRLKARIHAAVARHRHYPRLARRRGLEGTVVLAFRISQAGSITDLRVERSAGALLDDAARAAVRKAGPLPPYGDVIRIPVRFRLDD